MGSDLCPKPAEGVNFKPFESWIKGESKVEPQPIDKDVFGDGTVIVLRTPGHTPGHSSLLVKLAGMGAVILVGDAVHFHENYESVGVPCSTSIAPSPWLRSSASRKSQVL